jgi:hypothetical protein
LPSKKHFKQQLLGVIIFGSIRFLSKKVTKPKFIYFLKKKTETEPKPGQTDRVRFGLGFLGQKQVQTGLARFFRFWLGFSGLARFGSVFPVWLGLARFFSGFLSVSVRFGFFGFLFIKPKPNRPVFFKN